MMKVSKKIAVFAVLLLGVILFPLSLTKPSNNSQVVLSKSNLVVLSGEVEGELSGRVISEAKALDASRLSSGKPIYVFMNTPGGSIQTGLEMIEALKGLNRPVTTVTLFSASMGFQIVQNLGERLILKNGVLMSHRAAGGFEGYFGGQRPSQMDNRYNLWLTRLTELDQQVVDRTGGKQTLASYQKAYSDELWLTGQQSVVGGYADRIVTVKCDSSLDGVTTHNIEFLGLKISYDLDNCPINTSPMHIRVASPEEKQPLTRERAKDAEARFLESYITKHRSIIPMYW
jgi:ATP-dependent Clp protease protease subunit